MGTILRNVFNLPINSNVPNSVLVLSKRFRGKINIQKPRAPHYEKARILKLTEPYFPAIKKHLPLTQLCKNLKPRVKDDDVENPFQRILARECLNWFNHSRLVVHFHANPMSGDEQFRTWIAYRKFNMHLKKFGKKTLKLALNGTRFEPFLENYVSQNVLLFASEPDIKNVLRANKKTSQLVLLSAIFEGKFISKDELLMYSKITDIQIARAQLVQTLQNVGGQLHSHLTQTQSTFVNRLRDRGEQLKETES